MMWKKKIADKSQDSKIILAMVMLHAENSFSVDSFVNNFKSLYGDNIKKPTGDNGSFAFTVDEETIVIAHMDLPIPASDIESTAQYAYNWPTALEDIKDHKSHLIICLMQGGQDEVKRFKAFTKVLCSVLTTTNAIGVYKGDQSLLIPKDDYLNEARKMSDQHLPLNVWVYFGLRVTAAGNSGYTYGLKKFNKTELEIVNSSRSLEDIRKLLFDIAHYLLYYDVTFQHGDTTGGSQEEKIPIEYSKGHFVAGDTFKLVF
jgi:hypothetical protein